MIYTVTLNPTLDITYVLENISFGEPVKAVEVQKSPGGKGINVSRALRAMGTDTVAMSMVGGHVGDEADLASYLLFDGAFARKLIDLGRADAEAMREKILAFFSP